MCVCVCGKVDEMGSRIEDLEKSIGDLVAQAEDPTTNKYDSNNWIKPHYMYKRIILQKIHHIPSLKLQIKMSYKDGEEAFKDFLLRFFNNEPAKSVDGNKVDDDDGDWFVVCEVSIGAMVNVVSETEGNKSSWLSTSGTIPSSSFATWGRFNLTGDGKRMGACTSTSDSVMGRGVGEGGDEDGIIGEDDGCSTWNEGDCSKGDEGIIHDKLCWGRINGDDGDGVVDVASNRGDCCNVPNEENSVVGLFNLVLSNFDFEGEEDTEDSKWDNFWEDFGVDMEDGSEAL